MDLRLWRSALDYVRQEHEANLGVTTTPIVRWHIYSSPEHQKPIAPTYRMYRECSENSAAPLPSGWERIPNGGFKHRRDPEIEFAYPVPMGDIESPLNVSQISVLISCRAFRAYLRFGSIYEDRTGGPCDIAIVAPTDRKIGVLRLNSRWLSAQRFRGEICELIAISSGINELGSREILVVPTSRYVDPHEFYNVLWIEWVDGIAYRKGWVEWRSLGGNPPILKRLR